MEDLSSLRFVLATVAGSNDKKVINDEENIFLQALDATCASYSAEDLKLVERIMLIYDFYSAFRDKLSVEATQANPMFNLFRKVLEPLGIIRWQEVDETTFLTTLKSLNCNNPDIDQLRNQFVKAIEADVQGK